MSISYIPIDLKIEDYQDWDINDEVISNFESIENYKYNIKELRNNSKYLESLPVETILNFFDSLAIYWLNDKDSKFLTSFSNLITFVRINIKNKNKRVNNK